MTEAAINPLRRRMIEDMTVRNRCCQANGKLSPVGADSRASVGGTPVEPLFLMLER